MGRLFQHLLLNRAACQGLREAVRPFSDEDALEFCTKLYAVFYALEADDDKEIVDLYVTVGDVMLINNFVSAEDGDWAKDILHQTRQAFYELNTGKEAVRLASTENVQHLLEGVEINLDG